MNRQPMGLGSVIGLDIGNTTIKVAEVRATKQGPQVIALGIAPTPLDSVNQSNFVDTAALGDAVKELLSSCGARARNVVSSVAGQQSLVIRIIEVPRMTEKELSETMKWEVERHVPFAQSELQMDYQIIRRPDTPPDAQTMEVLLVVAQKEMIVTHLEALQACGLEPAAIDVEPSALARSLVDIHGPAQTKRTVALVNLGAQITDISIVRDGLLLFQRTIATAGDTLTQAIAAALNINAEEAERIKKTHAAVDLEAFSTAPSGGGGDDVFGGDGDAPFGFGVPTFDTPADAPVAPAGPAESPTLFNPFAAPAAEPAAAPPAEAPAAFNPFGASEEPPADSPPAPAPPAGPAPDAGGTPQWSPFDLAATDGAAGEDSNPFSLPAPAGQPTASPFGEPTAALDSGDDAFDLSAFGGSDFGGLADTGASSQELTPRQVFDIIREPLSDLVTEIKRSVDYYRGRSGDATVDMMLLSGGTARLANLDQLLAGELGLPVRVADPFEAVPVQSSQYPEEYLKQIAPLFAVCVGLGLRETVF